MSASHHLPIPSLDALAFVADLAAKDKPSRLKARTGPPSRALVTWARPNGEAGMGDLYRPAGPSRAALLLVPGVAKDGKDDPRLIGFATTICRLGFTVLVPELTSLRSLNVRPAHVGIVRDAFAWMLAQGFAPAANSGIGGLSFAMGPGVVAALQPEIRDQVRFLFCIGGYFDLHAEIKFVTTGETRERGGGLPDGPVLHIEPDHYGRWVLVASMIDNVPDAGSRAALRAIVDRRVEAEHAPIDDLLAAVTDPGGLALLALARNTDAAAFEGLYDALPRAMKDDFDAMDVAKQDLSGLRAELVLVHGIGDELIPYTESLALHRGVKKGQSRIYLLRGLAHVNMGKLTALDVWRMMAAVTALLGQRA